ncbi:plasmid recombination protein (plasmid) [Limosilactobacillus vaginalis]|uniref:MobV family relaxase n=1 Tax=Limosilactobacillus vaginalis TaxID=1633 RepID=UPI0021B5F96D|nr:MobV family relaxase [Limosilactobacillus vaginalis]UXC70128.1 plasmid recombination protein [Limosilactobacillus vaginalis]
MSKNHYAVATMKKMKIDNLSGIFRHDFRETDNHKNQDIDPSKSNQNIELVADHKLRKRDVMDFIQKHRVGSRKVRRDAVVLDEWIIGSDHGYFAEKSPEEVRKYFSDAIGYFAQKFGRENILYGNVHLDESTPHMHMGIVPITKDHKLSSKRVFDRNTLREIQTEFPKYMQEHGHEVVRGSEKSQRKKLSVAEYKHAKEEQKEIEQQRIENFDREIELNQREGTIDNVERDILHVAKEVDPQNAPQDTISNILEWLKRFVQKLKKRLEEVTRREQNVQRQAKQLKQAKKELDVRNNALTRNENSVRFLVSVLKQQPTRKMTNQELLLDKLSTVKDFVKTYDEGKLEKELGKSLDQSIQEIKTFSNPSKVPQQGLNLLNQTKDIKH